MTLLKVTPEDFNLFKPLYSNSDLQWLYKRSEDLPPCSFDVELEFGKENLNQIANKFKNYSKDDFYKELATNDIYFIAENNIITGFISVNRGKRIYDWAMPSPSLDKAQSVVAQLIKLRPRMKKGLTVACCPSQFRYIIQELPEVSFL